MSTWKEVQDILPGIVRDLASQRERALLDAWTASLVDPEGRGVVVHESMPEWGDGVSDNSYSLTVTEWVGLSATVPQGEIHVHQSAPDACFCQELRAGN